MGLRWNINQERRLITVVASGDVTKEEFEAYLEVQAAADAIAYRRLFDGSAADTSMSPMALLGIGVKIKSFHDRQVGPLAIVLPPDRAHVIARILGILATANRPMRIFHTVTEAQRWLDRLEYEPLPAPPGGRRRAQEERD